MLKTMDTKKLLTKLTDGNRLYSGSGKYAGDVSSDARARTVDGQKPYAAVLTCSDSRVIPEVVFQAGIGDLFVIRTAGNVVDETALACVEYAVEHLGVRLIVVMGHTHCGAVHAALHGEFGGKVGYLTRRIAAAVGSERDETAACRKNVAASVRTLQDAFLVEDISILGAVYDIAQGTVEFPVQK